MKFFYFFFGGFPYQLIKLFILGDMKIMHLKIQTGQKVLDLQGHNGDVAALSLNPKDENTFITGHSDKSRLLFLYS